MIKKIIMRILALILIALLFISLLLTPTGLKISLDLTNYFTSYKIQYHKITGGILGPLTIANFNFHHKNINISIKKLSLDWSFSDYLNHKINIKTIKADHVDITIGKNKSSNKQNSFPALPQSIKIDQIQINDLNVNNNQYSLLTSANIKGHIIIDDSLVDSDLTISSSQPKPWTANILLKGTPDNTDIKATLTSNNKKWFAVGKKQQNNIHFSTNNNQLLSGSLSLTGQATLQPLTWNTSIQANHLNLSVINPNLPKAITFNINSEGSTDNNHQIFTKNRITADNNNNHIALMINTSNQLKVNWKLNCRQLSSLTPLISGDIHSHGSAIIKKNNIQSTGTIISKKMSIGESSLSQVNSRWSVSNDNATSSFIHLTAKRAQYHHLTLNQTNLNLNGNPAQHRLRFNSNVNGIQSTIKLTGKIQKNNWLAHIQTFSLKNKKIIFTNHNNITLDVNDNGILLDHFCLQSEHKQSACFDFQMKPSSSWSGSINTNQFPYQFISPLLPYNLQGSANITLQAKASGLDQTIQALSSQLTLNKLSLKNLHTPISDKIEKINSRIKLTKTTLKTNSIATIDNNNSIHFSFNSNNLLQNNIKNSTINGSINAQLNNIATLNNLFPDVNILNGHLNSHLSITGTVSHPKLAGDASITQANIYSPLIGLMLKNISTHITSTLSTLKTDTRLYIQSKPMHIQSSTQLTSANYDTQGSITGSDILLYNTPQYVVYGSPNIKFKVNTKQAFLSGEISIPKATIKPIQALHTISLPADDIEYTDDEHALFSHYPYGFSIYAKLGDNISIDVKGIKALVTGRLLLKKDLNHPIFANGDISLIKGSYQTYGNQLDIAKNSALLFSNSLITQPDLFITASKKIQFASSSFSQGMNNNQVTVGVKVTGNIKKPKLSLYSIPATLSQTQILSYLILGYSLDTNASQTKNNQNLFNALNALKLAQSGLSSPHSGGFISQVRSSLGLSELNINTQTTSDALGNQIDSTPQTSFVIGKYITKNIYIKYIQDLSSLTPLKVFQAIFYFTPKWSVQASTTVSSQKTNSTSQLTTNSYYNGVDLMYSFNRK